MDVAGGLAATEQVKYTSSPSFRSSGRRERPKEAFTVGGSEGREKTSLLMKEARKKGMVSRML